MGEGWAINVRRNQTIATKLLPGIYMSSVRHIAVRRKYINMWALSFIPVSAQGIQVSVMIIVIGYGLYMRLDIEMSRRQHIHV